ncbi:MAG: hypothetical protein K5778_09755 [Bacteroidaceae bacterium]|nr:hypothetical protein [Bacteroidaceae bacterium]MDO4993701.1 hypothetical protein [Bacteroidales bacterium]
MTKKEYFQPEMKKELLQTDYLCNLQQGSGEYDGSMDIDTKERDDFAADAVFDTQWGSLWG